MYTYKKKRRDSGLRGALEAPLHTARVRWPAKVAAPPPSRPVQRPAHVPPLDGRPMVGVRRGLPRPSSPAAAAAAEDGNPEQDGAKTGGGEQRMGAVSEVPPQRRGREAKGITSKHKALKKN